MHSGFGNMRNALPMNCRRVYENFSIPEVAKSDIERIISIWENCRSKFHHEGPYLFGQFSVADAMFAPVVSRFHTYGVCVPPTVQAYMEAILSCPAMSAWMAAAAAETEIIEKEER